MAAFKLRPVMPLEHDIQSQIIAYLKVEVARGRIGWFCRVNGGTRKIGNRWLATYRYWMPGNLNCERGYPDIHGMLGHKSAAPGRYWALEIKRDRKQGESKEQAVFIAETRKHGGIAAVVSSFDEAKEALFGAETR